MVLFYFKLIIELHNLTDTLQNAIHRAVQCIKWGFQYLTVLLKFTQNNPAKTTNKTTKTTFNMLINAHDRQTTWLCRLTKKTLKNDINSSLKCCLENYLVSYSIKHDIEHQQIEKQTGTNASK